MATKKVTKKASGENIPEAMRKTKALKARLRPETDAYIRMLAKSWQCPISYVVEVMAEFTRRSFAEGHTAVNEGFEDILTDLYERDGQ